MWRALETELRQLLNGHAEGNLGYKPRRNLRATAPALDPTSSNLVNGVLGLESEGRDLDVELSSARADHLIRAPHHTHGGLERAPGRILERLASPQHRLLANHSRPSDFFRVFHPIRDDPVPAQ